LFFKAIFAGGPSRNRTGVQGFAVLCVTTPPSGLEATDMLPTAILNVVEAGI
jgi:hypothetical protein